MTAPTAAEAAGWPEHVLDATQQGLVELMLLGALPPAFTSDLPLTTTADVRAGQLLALRDAEGVTLAGLEVAAAPPQVTGRVVAISGPTHHDALDLRLSPSDVADWAAGRPLVGVLSDGPLRDNQLDALVAAAGDAHAVLLLATLGPHDVGDASWYARLAAARATADALRARLAPDRVALVAVPDPGRDDLRTAVVTAFRADPLESLRRRAPGRPPSNRP